MMSQWQATLLICVNFGACLFMLWRTAKDKQEAYLKGHYDGQKEMCSSLKKQMEGIYTPEGQALLHYAQRTEKLLDRKLSEPL